MCNGAVEADKALKNESDFNGELNGKVLAVVEETDLGKGKGVYAKMKNWVTADEIGIQFKGKDVCMMPNYTHWVQTANHRDDCPVEDGDERVVMTEVTRLLPYEEVHKLKMLEGLKKEAPYFLRTLMDVQFAEPFGRLYLPVLQTEEKTEAMQTIKTEQPLTKRQKQLAEAILNLKSLWGKFQGNASDLSDQLGDGWKEASVGRLLRKIVDYLNKQGVDVRLSRRTSDARGQLVITGLKLLELPPLPSCDFPDESELSDEELGEDEEWVGRLLDDLTQREFATRSGNGRKTDDPRDSCHTSTI